ncbi:MAG TPA: hypothetical protein VI413_01775, partial [Paludibacter sp.]
DRNKMQFTHSAVQLQVCLHVSDSKTSSRVTTCITHHHFPYCPHGLFAQQSIHPAVGARLEVVRHYTNYSDYHLSTFGFHSVYFRFPFIDNTYIIHI